MSLLPKGRFRLLFLCFFFSLTGCGDPQPADTLQPLWSGLYDFDSALPTIETFKNLHVDGSGNTITVATYVNEDASDRQDQILLVKRDNDGAVLWQFIYDLLDSGNAAYGINSSAMDANGNVVIVGSIRMIDGAAGPNSYVVQIGPDGALQWQDSFAGYRAGPQTVQIKNNKIYVSGFASRVYNAQGSLVVNVAHPERFDWSINADTSDNIYTSGNRYVTKYNGDGVVLWQEPVRAGISTDTPPGGNLSADVAVDSNGRVHVVSVAVKDGSSDAFVFLRTFSSDGALLREADYPYPQSTLGFAYAPLLHVTSQDALLLAISYNRTRHIYRFAQNGEQQWFYESGQGGLSQLVLDAQDNVYVAGGGVLEKLTSSGALSYNVSGCGYRGFQKTTAVLYGDTVFLGSQGSSNDSPFSSSADSLDVCLSKYANP